MNVVVQAISQRTSFDKFIEWYPENSEYRYELHEGVIVEMPKSTGIGQNAQRADNAVEAYQPPTPGSLQFYSI